VARRAWIPTSTWPSPDARPDRFYRLAARIERELSLPLDLVDLDRAPADLAQAVRTDGIRLIPQASSHDQA
jgi:hypothetical protein